MTFCLPHLAKNNVYIYLQPHTVPPIVHTKSLHSLRSFACSFIHPSIVSSSSFLRSHLCPCPRLCLHPWRHPMGIRWGAAAVCSGGADEEDVDVDVVVEDGFIDTDADTGTDVDVDVDEDA